MQESPFEEEIDKKKMRVQKFMSMDITNHSDSVFLF